jgi:hypothetical protein
MWSAASRVASERRSVAYKRLNKQACVQRLTHRGVPKDARVALRVAGSGVMDDLVRQLAAIEELPHAERLRRALVRSSKPLSFDDLVSAAAGHGARLSDVVNWLAATRDAGLIEDAPQDVRYAGRAARRRRVRLSADGRRAWIGQSRNSARGQ